MEAILAARHTPRMVTFPYFSVGTFIEAMVRRWRPPRLSHFPFFFGGAFFEAACGLCGRLTDRLSLPFWRGFH